MIESFNGSVSDIPPEVRLFIKNSQCIPNQSWICCARPPVIPKATTTRPTTTTPAPILDLPTAPECGVDTDIRRRILNGEVTRIDEYPWLVLLVKVYTDDREHSIETKKFTQLNIISRIFSAKQSNYTDCGGALINHRFLSFESLISDFFDCCVFSILPADMLSLLHIVLRSHFRL